MIATASPHKVQCNRRANSRESQSTRRPPHVVPAVEIEYVHHPLFAAEDPESDIEKLRPAATSPESDREAREHVAHELLGALLERPPLSRDEERYLFLRMNYCRYRASQLSRLGTRHAARRIRVLLREATSIRNQLAEANQRLVVSVARGFASPSLTLDDLTASAQLPLLRAVELFDVSRGYCFSTYATHTIRNHCGRVLSRRARRNRQVSVGLPNHLEPSESRQPEEEVEPIERSLIRRFFAELLDREKTLLAARFGLDEFDRPHTFLEIGKLLGLSKERARVLAGRAIEKLQELACRQELTWFKA